MRKQLGVDLVFLASGSIRKESLGPIITLKDFLEVFPFEDGLISFNMTGAQLRKVMKFLMREEAFDPDAHCEWYQISGNFFCEYDRGTGEILTLAVYGNDVKDSDVFRVAVQEYHFFSMSEFMGIPTEEIEQNGQPEELAVKGQNVLKEFFVRNEYIKLDGKQRLLIHNGKNG